MTEVVQGLERTIYKSQSATARLLLAHGAGAGNKHEFMDSLAKGLANQGIEVISFNFPYMQTAYETEKKRPPNTNKVLQQHYVDEINRLPKDLPIFIAGKSMGGRVASQVLATKRDSFSNEVAGLVVYGYPFIPPGKPEKLTERVSHFPDIQLPFLILQGERDTFGNKQLVSELQLEPNIAVNLVSSGDHSFKPLKSSGTNLVENMQLAIQQTLEFING